MDMAIRTLRPESSKGKPNAPLLSQFSRKLVRETATPLLPKNWTFYPVGIEVGNAS